MFYSQIILAKKGPLGKIWQAAHWGDKKLGRPAVFSTNIETAVDHIVDPAIPLALRVSSHLLWGVVRIYSRQVQYLLDDCQQAMTKVSFVNHQTNSKSNTAAAKIDLNVSKQQQNHLNVSNFAEHVPTDGGIVDFAIPFMEETDEADWVPAELPEESPVRIPQPVEEYEIVNDEHWGGVEFDPDDENATDSTGSVERPREAKSENQSDILKNIDTSNEVSGNIPSEDDAADFPPNNDDFLPFDDDVDMAAPPPPPEDSSIMDSGIADITNDQSSLNIGFGDSPVKDDAEPIKKRKTQSARKAKKKRRKIITDGSELSSDHIRKMIDDTSPTILQQESDSEPSSKPQRSVGESFLYPCMEGVMPESVLNIWKRNMSCALGKSDPYEMDNDDDDDAVEVARDAPDIPQVEPQDDSFPTMDEDLPPPPQDEDMIPFDDEPPMMDDSMPPPDMHQLSDEDDDRSVFSLGATNDLQDDIEIDEPVGSTKWHKNTIKVFDILKQNLKEKEVVSFEVLSKKATRRTAAGFFFEMLQLKTLNYIEVDQNQSFGDIQITQGVRFDEDIAM